MNVLESRRHRTARNRARTLEHRLLAEGLLPIDLRKSLDAARTAQRYTQRTGDVVQEAYALNQQAVCLYQLGRLGEAFSAARLSLRRFKVLDHLRGMAAASYTLGILYHLRGRSRLSRQYYRQALGLYEQAEDWIGQCRVRNALGNLATATEGATPEVIGQFETALEIARRIGDRTGESLLLRNLAIVHQERREHADARRRAQEALELCRAIGLVKGEAGCLLILGEHWLLQREFDEARSCLQRALRLAVRAGSRLDEIDAFNGLGRLLLATGRPAVALRRFRRTLRMARALGDTRRGVDALLGVGQSLAGWGDAAGAGKALRETATRARAAGQKGLWREARAALAALTPAARLPRGRLTVARE